MTGDPAIARIAGMQHGVVTRTQLLGAGLSRRAIQHRLAQKRLHPVHRGVYLVGHPVPPPLAREMAAVLACGDQAVLSHDPAASVLGFRAWKGGPIDITLPSRCTRSRPGIRMHSTREFRPRDVRHHSRIPLTSPARTLLDLANVLSRNELQRAVEEAQIRRLVGRTELMARLDETPRRPGASLLRSLLEVPPALSRSEAEARLLDLLRSADLPPSATNIRVGRHEVDFLWSSQRLVVEVDGFAYHASRSAFERDRLRDAELQAAGYRVVRVTWSQIEARPQALIARLAQALVL
jgi:very-short-patch-repair endonuclease